MTVAKLSAGDGYTYYISETVSADVRREAGQELGDYYLAQGNPPGVWTGSGIGALGMDGEVTEAQMKALYGEGLHPDADRIIAEKIAEGVSPQAARRAAQLGRRYMQFKMPEGPSLAEQTTAEVERFERENHRSPDPEEHRLIRTRVAAIAFRRDYGRDAGTKEELARFISSKSKPARQAVAGYDLQFAPAKSVSTLWALGDEDTRRAVEAAHEAAIDRTLGWIEREATATRTGYNGVAQVDTLGGLVATRFRHHDSRAGDPQLHDHVVIANKVRSRDGEGEKWRTIDGRLLYRLSVAASEHYNSAVLEEVSTRLGLTVEDREVTPGKRPVAEIAGVDDRLTTLWSSRSLDVKDRTRQLVEEHRQAHGKEPDERTLIHLAQQATLETRPTKATARSLPQLRATWREAAAEIVGADAVADVLASAQRAAQRSRDSTLTTGGPDTLDLTSGVSAGVDGGVDIDQVAAEITTTVAEHRSVWGRHHLEAEARRWSTRYARGRHVPEELVRAITDRAAGVESVAITGTEPHADFAPLTRASDGRSIYTQRASDLFTSSAVLAAEDRVLSAARTEVIPAVSPETFDTVLQASTARLDAGQLALAREFATSSRLVVAGIGPAGTGKTTSLSLLTEAVQAQGGRVIGLAPSARAAQVMSSELGTPAHTLHSWLGQRARAIARAAETGTAVVLSEDLQLRAGDVIVVDEAGMAGSLRLADVVAQADAAGAHVRLIGDPAQLAAVESGGVLRLLASEVGAVELETVWRFADPAEAAASLQLRDGSFQLTSARNTDPAAAPGAAAFGWYTDAGRVTGGDSDVMADAVFAAWQRDTLAGKTSLMLAPDNTTVAELNTRAQAFAVASGTVDPAVRVPLRDGLHACPGDVVVTRANDRTTRVHDGMDFVKNGDTWTVEAIRADGGLDLLHRTHRGRVTLSADYVARSVELGYAATVHRAQGATVDTAHALVNETTSREAAYVALTRGRDRNQLFVTTEPGKSMHDVLDAIAARTTQSVSAHEAIRAEQDRTIDLEHLVDVHADVAERADAQRLQHVVREVLGAGAERFLAADGWPGMARSLRDGERAGVDLPTLLRAADTMREWTDADDDAAVMSWRLDRVLEEITTAREDAGIDPDALLADPTAALAEAAAARPLGTLTAQQLHRLEATATADLRQARAEQIRDARRVGTATATATPAPITVDDVEHPAWIERAHGGLDSAQLHEAIATARTTARRATHAADSEQARAAYEELRRLQDERALRKAMTPAEHSTESIQRAAVATAEAAGSPSPESSTAADAADTSTPTQTPTRARLGTTAERVARVEILHDRIAGELRLRDRLAPATPPPPAPDALPEWLAPSRAVTDPHTPAAWREHLLERRTFLITRLHQVGEEVATEQPQWASDLGPLPDVDDPQRERWTSLAGQVELWRRQHRIPTTPTVLPLPDGEQPEQGGQVEQQARIRQQALPPEDGPRRPDSTPSRRELVAEQLRPQVTSLRRQLTPVTVAAPAPEPSATTSAAPVAVEVTSNWRDLFASSPTLSPAPSPTSATTTSTAIEDEDTPTPEVTMSRYTFTTDTEQWSVGYDTTLETHYAQVEPLRDRAVTDAALDPELDDDLDAEFEDEFPVPTLEEAREREQAAYRRYLSEDREDPSDYLEARSYREALEEEAADPAVAGIDSPDVADVTPDGADGTDIDDDELQDVVGQTPAEAPTPADLERLLASRVQLPQAVMEQLIADAPPAPNVERVEQRLEAAEHLVTGAQENAEDLQARWEALKANSVSNRLAHLTGGRTPARTGGSSPADVKSSTPITPDNVHAAERAQAEEHEHHQQPGQGPARGPRR
ncbi:MobF family relaxase [Kineococcus sp. R86509]|uniref:MobF family relaxase n=1 Tax=Kineococcus sp. R86509 TaxID=3093851 RepID=UPI0036D2FF30